MRRRHSSNALAAKALKRAWKMLSISQRAAAISWRADVGDENRK